MRWGGAIQCFAVFIIWAFDFTVRLLDQLVMPYCNTDSVVALYKIRIIFLHLPHTLSQRGKCRHWWIRAQALATCMCHFKSLGSSLAQGGEPHTMQVSRSCPTPLLCPVCDTRGHYHCEPTDICWYMFDTCHSPSPCFPIACLSPLYYCIKQKKMSKNILKKVNTQSPHFWCIQSMVTVHS